MVLEGEQWAHGDYPCIVTNLTVALRISKQYSISKFCEFLWNKTLSMIFVLFKHVALIVWTTSMIVGTSVKRSTSHGLGLWFPNLSPSFYGADTRKHGEAQTIELLCLGSGTVGGTTYCHTHLFLGIWIYISLCALQIIYFFPIPLCLYNIIYRHIILWFRLFFLNKSCWKVTFRNRMLLESDYTHSLSSVWVWDFLNMC